MGRPARMRTFRMRHPARAPPRGTSGQTTPAYAMLRMRGPKREFGYPRVTMLSSDLVRNVLDSLPDALIIIGADGKIRFANHQVFEMFGLSPTEVIGATVEILLPERFRERHVNHRNGFAHSVRERPMGAGLELFGRRKDGAEFPVEISLSPVKQGEEPMVAAAIRDVTGRKLVEQALRDA